jgi:hypothetical protein
MIKPSESTTRQMVASIHLLNHALLTQAYKVSPVEMIGLFELSLPVPWIAKIDLDSSITTLPPPRPG